MAYKNAEYGKLRRKELYRDHGKGSKKKSYERDREKTLKRKREYYKENCERIKQYQRDFRQREDFSQKHSIHVRNWKDRVFDKILLHYGSKCVCCGEGNKKFLTVDHVDGGGNKHRKSIGYLRSWIVKNDFPEGYQILCAIGDEHTTMVFVHIRSNKKWLKHNKPIVCPLCRVGTWALMPTTRSQTWRGRLRLLP